MTPTSAIASDPAARTFETSSDVRRLRIAMLSMHSSPLGQLGTGDTGGMSVYIRELSAELGRAGHCVDIYTCAMDGGHTTELLLSENVRVIRLRIGQGLQVTKGMLYWHLAEVFRSLDAYVTANGLCYDIIHSHYWLSGMVGRQAQNRWSVPHAIMFHTTGMAKRIACGGEREPAHRLIAERRLALTSDKTFTATKHESDSLVKFYGVPVEKIRIVPCGVNLDRFRPIERELARRELGLQDTESIVLYVGRFAPVKGLDRLFAAAAHLRTYRGLKFVIIGGDGPQAHSFTDLTRLAKKASISNMIAFRGRVEHDLLPLYYNAADVLVMPSYYESFGLVGLESLACGTPVLAGNVGAMDSLIRNGRTGLLSDTGNPRSLAAARKGIIEGTPNTLASTEEIRASVLGYGWRNIASAVLQGYSDIIQSCLSRGNRDFDNICLE